MNGSVRLLEAPSWSALRALPGMNWLWLDIRPPGAHVSPGLPEARPAGATHIWGWGDDQWVRARIDSSLPAGLAVAILSADEHRGLPANVTLMRGELWPIEDQRVGLIATFREAGGVAPAVRLARFHAGAESRVLEFLELGVEG